MPTYGINDIVVFLPGILGSALEKDGKAVWDTSAGAIWRALISGGDSIRELALETPDDPSLDDLGDGIVATKLIPDVHIVPGLWKIDGYTKLMKSIKKAFGLKYGKNAFPFPYDWRRDNRVAARKLKRSVERWLGAWRKHQPGARAVLVAHSMGGLVARYFLEVLGGWEYVRALITFGTPYGGSVKALDFITNGYRPGVGRLRLDLSPVLRSFTSIYQLLPTYECVATDGGTLCEIRRVPSLPHIDYGQVAAALAFHDEIADGVRWRSDRAEPRIIPVVGIEQPTLQSAYFADGKVHVLRTRNGKDESGDGTVPRVSAVPFELLDAEREVYAAEAHGSLQNRDSILDHLRGVLSAPSDKIKRIRAGDRISLSLSLPDAFAAENVIELSVTPSDGQPLLSATLTTADERKVATEPFRPQIDGTQQVAFEPQREGIYRVRVEGQAGVSPVTDVFIVAGTGP